MVGHEEYCFRISFATGLFCPVAIDDHAKNGGNELSTKMHHKLITNL